MFTSHRYSCSRQLYTIPPIRTGILTVEEAAKEFTVIEEKEKEREEKERQQREKITNIDVGFISRFVLACCISCIGLFTV